jgi:hypothetical protein
MANPNRPEYQDTIESSWGQLVADHVVRRYGTAAERDADLAGLTAPELEGQVVNVNGDIQVYRAGAWVTRAFTVSGASTVTTDGFGNAAIGLPAGARSLGAAMSGAQIGFQFVPVRNTQDSPLGSPSVMFVIYNTAGGTHPNTAVALSWVIAATY